MDNEKQRQMALIQELVVISSAHPCTCRTYLARNNWDVQKAVKEMREETAEAMRKYSPFI